MSRFLDPIPMDKQPNEEENVFYPLVYRAMYNSDVDDIKNFLPSYIERNINPASFFSMKQTTFSMSIFDNEEVMMKKLKLNVKKWNELNAIATGHTDIQKGISTLAKENHINYYLYDYRNNSPKSDFIFYKDIDKTNE